MGLEIQVKVLARLAFPPFRVARANLLALPLVAMALAGCAVYTVTINVDGLAHPEAGAASSLSKEELARAEDIVSQTAANFGLGKVTPNAPYSPQSGYPYRQVALYVPKEVSSSQKQISILVLERTDGSELRVSVNDFSSGSETLLVRGMRNILEQRLSTALPNRHITVESKRWYRDFFAP